jgi:hypothetical protein
MIDTNCVGGPLLSLKKATVKRTVALPRFLSVF